MKIIKVNLSELIKPEKNVRIHTENQIKEFVRSIKMFGQIRPVVIDENNVILAGNGLVEALERASIDTADCYKMESLTDNQKKKLMIADNKIFSLGVENLETLNSFFEELEGDFDVPGFDEEILKAMMAQADEVTEKLSTYGTLDEQEISAIKEASIIREDVALAPNSTLERSNEILSISKDDNDEANEQRCIICPKCGEKIWL